MTVKTARKPSNDPVQEKLRQDKAVFNKEMSLFLNDVIHLKKLMNGWPSKFFKERSRITAPIPADPGTILGSLANDFQELAQKGASIVAEQLDYAKNRRQKQIKLTGPGPSAPAAAPSTPEAPAPSGTDLSKQLAAWEQKYDLVSEASNPISRFLTRRLTRIRGFDDRARDNRIRMDMLRSAVKAYKALGKLQIQVVAGRKDSIDQANKMMQTAWHEWSILARSFATFKQLTTNQPPTDGAPSVELPPDEKEHQEPPLETGKQEPIDTGYIHRISRDVYDYGPLFTDKGSQSLLKDIGKIRPMGFKTPDGIIPTGAPIALKHLYDRLINHLNDLYGMQASSLKEIVDLSKKEKPILPIPAPAPIVPKAETKKDDQPPKPATELETVAQAFVKKWLGKRRQQLFPQPNSSYRLEIFKMATQLRKDINLVMNSLEKGLDYQQLEGLVSSINKQMSTLRMLMRSLHLSDKPGESGFMPL